MIFGSICSGIEAASVAWLPLGWKCAFTAEIESFPSAVLKHHYPHTPNYGDITKFQSWPDHSIDVLIGGTPCQSFSIAGLRAGLRDPRGNLALTFLAIAHRYRPRWLVWENVPGVHSSWSDETIRPPSEEECLRIIEAGGNPDDYEYAEQSNDFDQFLAGMEELGYGIATAILDAQYFNLAQRRERVFVIGHSGRQWQRAAAVLFDASCLRRDLAPRREAGKRIAPTLEAGIGRSGTPNDFHLAGGLAPCLPASGRGFSRTGDTRGQDCVMPVVAWALQERDSKGSDSSTKEGHLIPVENQVSTLAIRGRAGSPELEIRNDGMANALMTPTGGRDGTGTGAIHRHTEVRRLTPLECERLQGFPENYTKLTEKTADSPRYKALGNSMAVPVIQWIGQQIQLINSIP